MKRKEKQTKQSTIPIKRAKELFSFILWYGPINTWNVKTVIVKTVHDFLWFTVYVSGNLKIQVRVYKIKGPGSWIRKH